MDVPGLEAGVTETVTRDQYVPSRAAVLRTTLTAVLAVRTGRRRWEWEMVPPLWETVRQVPKKQNPRKNNNNNKKKPSKNPLQPDPAIALLGV